MFTISGGQLGTTYLAPRMGTNVLVKHITEIATTKFELKYDWFCYIHMSYIFRHIASGLIYFLYIMIFVTVPLSESCFYPVTTWDKLMVPYFTTRDSEYC